MVTLTGCATSFQSNTLSKVEHFPKINSAKSISVDLAFSGRLNGASWKANDQHNTIYLKNLCMEHLNESGMFGLVSSKSKTTDLKLQVAVINERTADPNRQLLTAVTLFIVPYKTTDTFRLLAVVSDPATGKKKRIELKESVSYYQQLLMAPFSLFSSYDAGLEECKNRLFDHLCLEIYNSGLLN